MKRTVLQDKEGQSVVVYVGFETMQEPPRPVPYSIPMGNLMRVLNDENYYGDLTTDFVGGFDSDVSPTCYTVWFSVGSEQAQDDIPRYFLGGVAYEDENKPVNQWVYSDIQDVYTRVFVYGCVKAWVHDYSWDYGTIDVEPRYRRWTEAAIAATPPPDWNGEQDS